MKISAKVLIGMLVFSSHFVNAQIEQDGLIAESTKVVEVENMSRYDYYPNLQAYYDRKTEEFLFIEDGIWVYDTAIPVNYRGYCVRNGFHVLIENYSGEEPYTLITEHKLKYPADYSTKRQRPTVIVAAN